MTTKVKQDHMIPLPLLFLFKDEVTSKDFPAKVEVETRGRVLSLLDGGKVWMYGVQPGAIAASGNDRKEAAAAFRAAYKAVLLDIAEGVTDLSAFKEQARGFFNQVCEPREAEWWQAVEKVRKENYTEEGLRTKPASAPLAISIETLNVLALPPPQHSNADETEDPGADEVLLAA